MLVVHPEHPFAKTGAAVMAQVAQEPLIVYDPGDPGSSYFQFINRVCRDAGVTPKVEMNLDSVEAAKNMVQLGLGISFLPRGGVRRESDSGSSSLIALAETPAVLLPTCVLLRSGQQHGPAVVAFLKLLQETYGVTIQIPPADHRKAV